MGEVVDLVDLPGTITLAWSNPAERETLFYLASHQVNLIINMIDATHLSQGLALTMELLELQHPMLVALNIMKELSLIMLRQALGVTDFGAGLTPVQMITFSVFVVFYVPCLATLAVINRELGKRDMLTIAGLTIVIATIAALVARVAASKRY